MQTTDHATHAESTAMTPGATLVLVHGAWLGGWMWDDTADALRRQGHRVEVVDQLPSSGSEPERLGDLSADAAHVESLIAELSGPVVLCGHSYGGMVITELAAHPSVVQSIYLAAFWPQQGESLVSILGSGPPPDWQVIRDDGAVAITDDARRAIGALFADLDPAEAEAAREKLVLQSLSSFVEPSTGAAHAHATTYVLCLQDRAIPPAAQKAMAAAADDLVELDSAHCPQLSQPAALAEVLSTSVVRR